MRNPKVDEILAKLDKWQLEMALLRDLVLDCKLEETIKWGQPCYVLNNANVIIIHGFKTYVALLFFKGALLTDDANLLIQQTDNVQSGRQMRFESVQEIESLKTQIRSYIFEAIEVEKAGLKVEMKKTADFEVCEEFKMRMEEFEDLKLAFERLTPGRQRAYLLFFSQAKQSKTRQERIDKMTPKILMGKGLKDE